MSDVGEGDVMSDESVEVGSEDDIVGEEENGEEAMVVAVLPDAGNPYLSKFYNDDWLRENGWEPDEWE